MTQSDPRTDGLFDDCEGRLNILSGLLRRQGPALLEHVGAMPGTFHAVDVAHPERLDWRTAQLLIDTREGRYVHFSVADKEDGRPVGELVACPAFTANLRLILTRILDRALPDRDTRALAADDGNAIRHFAVPEAPETYCLSFHFNAVSQDFVRGLSAHGWMTLAAACEAVAADLEQIRSTPAG